MGKDELKSLQFKCLSKSTFFQGNLILGWMRFLEEVAPKRLQSPSQEAALHTHTHPHNHPQHMLLLGAPLKLVVEAVAVVVEVVLLLLLLLLLLLRSWSRRQNVGA